MLILNVLDVGFPHYLNEFLTGVSLMEDVSDVAGSDSGVERNVDRLMDTTEPARDCSHKLANSRQTSVNRRRTVRNEVDLLRFEAAVLAQLVRAFSLVYVPRERI